MIVHPLMFGMVLPDWLSIVLIGIVLFQFLVTIIAFVLFWRRGRVRAAQPSNQESGESSSQNTVGVKYGKTSIRNDLKLLQRHLGDEGRKSSLFFVLGDTLPESVQTVFAEHGGERLEGTQLDFHLYDRGILVVPKEPLTRLGTTERGAYDDLFQELLRIRPRRPVDGVVLSVSVETLRQTGDTDRTAARLHDQLVRLQKITGMRLPVHLLFYDTEKFSGFPELAGEYAGHRTEESGELPAYPLDWSPSSRYGTEWDGDSLHDAAESFAVKLQQARIMLFSDKHHEDADEARHLFLLADELEQSKPGFVRFCNRVFTRGVHHEPFVFRGVAFCGTITKEAEKSRFVFASKTLHERLPDAASLAIPIRRLFQARYKNIRILQVATISVLILWGIGMFWKLPTLKDEALSLRKFGDNWDTVYDYQLELKRENRRSYDSVKIGDLLAEMFLTTKKDGGKDLQSLFFPSSYFSQLPSDVLTWQQDFYHDAVNVILPLELKRKAENLYALPKKTGSSVELPPEIPLAPLETEEYKTLEKHVKESGEFFGMYRRYETLMKSGNIGDFLELTRHCCGTPESLMPALFDGKINGAETLLKTVVEDHRKARRRKEGTTPAVLPRSVVEEMTRTKFEYLTERFDEQIHDHNVLVGQLMQVESMLNDTTNLMDAPLDPDRLEYYWNLSNQSLLGLGDDRYNWILIAAPLYNDSNLPLRKKVVTTTCLDESDIARWDMKSDEKKRRQFERLQKLQSEQNGNFFELKKLHALVPLPWLQEFNVLLSQLRSEPFMKKVEKVHVVPLAGNPGSIEWDNRLLHDALQMADHYKKIFADKDPTRFTLARIKSCQQLIDNMHRLVADSRRIKRRSSIELPGEGNFRDVASSIIEILDIYRSFGSDAKRQYEELSEVADQQALAILKDIDSRCAKDRLYEPSRETLAIWDGKGTVLVPLLGIGTEGEVDVYLNLRRERLKYWKNRIDPIMNYLSNRSGFTSSGDDAARIERWKIIREGVDLHEAHTPNDPLGTLERFVKIELLNPERKPLSPSSNWFYQKMYELDAAAGIGDAKRSELDFFARWKKAAEFFNQHLAGRFPFVAEHFAKAPSASPDAIRAFYTLLPDIPKTPVDWVTPEDYVRFHETMIAIKPLFFGKLQGPNTLPDLIVSVQYRFADPSECGCQRILDQSLQFDGQELSVRNGVTEGVWKFGSAVRFTLQWAKDGGVVPSTAPENRCAKIQGNRIIYDYDTPWSLFVFLCENVQPLLERDTAGDIDRSINVLAFEVATRPIGSNPSSGEDVDKLRTFARLRLQKANGDAEAEEIVLPRRFPDWMPTERGNKRFELSEQRPEPIERKSAEPQKIRPPVLLFPSGEMIVEEKIIWDVPMPILVPQPYPVPKLAPPLSVEGK